MLSDRLDTVFTSLRGGAEFLKGVVRHRNDDVREGRHSAS